MTTPDEPALSAEDHERLAELEQQLAEWRRRALDALPAHARALGPLLRRSVRTGRTNALARWCKRQNIRVRRRDLLALRDYLITRHLALRDLEPDARARLRDKALEREDLSLATPDYLGGIRAGDDLRCRDCHWFVEAPKDDDPVDMNDGKSCVELGTKGADRACAGFTRRAP
jgi:hypothetical protein